MNERENFTARYVYKLCKTHSFMNSLYGYFMLLAPLVGHVELIFHKLNVKSWSLSVPLVLNQPLQLWCLSKVNTILNPNPSAKDRNRFLILFKKIQKIGQVQY